jgi:hypothetical protein
MNDSDLDRLFAAARARRPDTSRQEYAFETRLMSRLRAQRQEQGDTSSIWAMVSWRMIPFFATCVMGLAMWHSQLSNTEETAAVNTVENPESAYLWNN